MAVCVSVSGQSHRGHGPARGVPSQVCQPPAHTPTPTPPSLDAIPNLDYFVPAFQVNTVQLQTVFVC